MPCFRMLLEVSTDANFATGWSNSPWFWAVFITYLSSLLGNAGDSLTYHSGASFSTKDRDHDTYVGNCAARFHGAWWYRKCHYSNLNGRYYNGSHASYADGVNWYHWKGYYYSIPLVSMKIQPVNLSCRS